MNTTVTALIASLLGLSQALTIFIVSRTKKDTTQINTAVNHVEPGSDTLTRRVDVITEDMTVVKGKAIETNRNIDERFDKIEQKTDNINGKIVSIEEILNNQTKDILAIRESVDRRKEPRP